MRKLFLLLSIAFLIALPTVAAVFVNLELETMKRSRIDGEPIARPSSEASLPKLNTSDSPMYFTIFRKILKVETTGSRAEGNLKPDITLPSGVNLATLEYNETAGWVIIEVWGTDHPLCEHPINMSDLDNVATQQTVTEVLVSHPLSPEKLGTFGISRSLAESLDETNKLVRVNGNEYSFVRIEERGSMYETIVLVEG